MTIVEDDMHPGQNGGDGGLCDSLEWADALTSSYSGHVKSDGE